MLTHPSGKTLKFNKKKHKYSVGNKEIISVTTLVDKFFPKFDRQGISKRYAEKHDLNQNDVLKEWRDKGIRTKDIGNRCHLYASNLVEYLYNSESKKIIKPYDVRYAIIADKIFELLEKYSVLYTECKIFSLKFDIAGTFDLLLTDDNILYLYDWKTVEKIDVENPWQTCNYPITHLDASKFNKFALQLNLYKFILESENYFTNTEYKMAILHVTESDCIEIPVPDMKREIKAIIIEREILNGKK